MGKLVFLIIFLILILIFPVYENFQIKLNNEKKIQNKIPLAKIINGEFFIYEVNLSKKGAFNSLNIFQNLYIAKDLNVSDLNKKEKFFARKAILKNKLLEAFIFKYENNKYAFNSNYVVYNLKTKNIYGKRFFLYSADYNASGYRFFIDKQRDIKAQNISFDLKVNK